MVTIEVSMVALTVKAAVLAAVRVAMAALEAWAVGTMALVAAAAAREGQVGQVATVALVGMPVAQQEVSRAARRPILVKGAPTASQGVASSCHAGDNSSRRNGVKNA